MFGAEQVGYGVQEGGGGGLVGDECDSADGFEGRSALAETIDELEGGDDGCVMMDVDCIVWGEVGLGGTDDAGELAAECRTGLPGALVLERAEITDTVLFKRGERLRLLAVWGDGVVVAGVGVERLGTGGMGG